MGAETYTKKDAADELALEIAWDEDEVKKCNRFQNPEGKSQHSVLSVALIWLPLLPFFCRCLCNELLWVHNIK